MTAGLRPEVRGAGYILLAGLIFITSTGIIKHLTTGLPEAVVVLLRSVFATAAFLPVILKSRGRILRTTRPFGHAWRTFVGMASFFAYVHAVAHLPMGDAVTLSFTTPMWSTLLGVLMLGERLGAGRVLALLAGFGGVMLIAKPTGSAVDIQPAVLVALGGAACTSLAMLSVKTLSRTEPPDRIALYFLLIGSLFAAPPAVLDWRTPDEAEWLWLVLLGLMTAVGQVALSRGYALGTFSRMAPLDFARLPMALLIGFAAFGEVPDTWSGLGMVVIAAASLYVVLGGARVAKARA